MNKGGWIDCSGYRLLADGVRGRVREDILQPVLDDFSPGLGASDSGGLFEPIRDILGKSDLRAQW